ncbi:MAG: PIN domain nuclease of toxin-antitoxin system [Candidatus Azotimanducaceae bacterium]|jgi:PIN domain nuclease of toxin-antitoxin system
MILLDTHVLIWLDQGAAFLGERARGLIESAYKAEEIGIAAITFWEIGRLVESKRLAFDGSLEPWRVSLMNTGFKEFPLSGQIALRASELAEFEGDPADRIIAATAMTVDAQLVTADRQLLNRSGLRTIDGTL